MREISSSEKKEIVKKFLLLPIIADKAEVGFKLVKDSDNGKEMIKSGQKYGGKKKRVADEDMSDIAIEFYKCIYEIEDILDDKYELQDNEFAGDTIHSILVVFINFEKSSQTISTLSIFLKK